MKIVASHLTVGLPAEQMSPSILGAQMVFAVLPSSLVQVVPWWMVFQANLHSRVPWLPDYTSLLSHRSKDGGLRSKWVIPSNCRTPCSSDVLWQGRCIGSCRAAQLLGAGGALAGHVLSIITLSCCLHTWMHLFAQSQEQRSVLDLLCTSDRILK